MRWSGIIIHAGAVFMHYLITWVMFKEKFETLYTELSFTEGLQYFFGGLICAHVKTTKKVLEVGWFLFFFNFWHRFATDFVEYSPRARMRWAWGRTQRWSTWWRWSSCRRAGLAGREGLRQTKYRKGQNTDEEGIEMCPKLLPLLFLGRSISTEKWLNLTNWRAAQFRDRDFLIADAKGNSGSFSQDNFFQ